MKRVGGAPNASAEEMGARGAAFSREQGRRTARNLRDVGVNVDLAPVLDVARPGRDDRRNRTRLRLDRASAVEATAVPFAEGACRTAGVAATGKHFPGLGAAAREHRLRGAADRASRRRGCGGSTRRRTGASSRSAATW